MLRSYHTYRMLMILASYQLPWIADWFEVLICFEFGILSWPKYSSRPILGWHLWFWPSFPRKRYSCNVLGHSCLQIWAECSRVACLNPTRNWIGSRSSRASCLAFFCVPFLSTGLAISRLWHLRRYRAAELLTIFMISGISKKTSQVCIIFFLFQYISLLLFIASYFFRFHAYHSSISSYNRRVHCFSVNSNPRKGH